MPAEKRARVAWRWSLAGALALSLAGIAGAQSTSIDVSGYPPEMQRHYRLFADKCSRCHDLSRPLGAPYTTQRQWRDVVAQMARRPGASISRRDQDQIVQFLVFHIEDRAKKRKEAGGTGAGGPEPGAGGRPPTPEPRRGDTSVAAGPRPPNTQHPTPPTQYPTPTPPIVATRDGLRIEALAGDPQPLRRLRDGRWVEDAPRGDETLYLAVRVIDEVSGEKLPYAQVSARVLGRPEPGGARILAPALGPGGFHYGGNLVAPRGRSRIAITVEPPSLAQVGDTPPRLTRPVTVEIELFR